MTTMQGEHNLRLVSIPKVVSRAGKGQTKYDSWFNSMLLDKRALQFPEDEFSAMKKAAFRFMEYNGLIGKMSFRQRKEARSKTYVVWFEEKKI